MNLQSLKAITSISRSAWFLGLSLLPALGALSSPAAAGSWKVDRYVYSVKSRGELQQWYQGQFVYELRKTDSDELSKTANTQYAREVFSYPLTTQLSAQRSYGSSPPTAQGWPIKAGEMYAHVSVHCVFKWQRRTLLNPQTWQSYPDPTDNPPQTLFIWEDANTTCTRYHSNAGDWPDSLYNAANPFAADWMPMPLLQIKNNFNVQSTHTQPSPQGMIDSRIGNRLSRIEIGGRESVPGPSVVLEGAVGIGAKDFKQYTEQASIQMAFSYEARAIDFTLSSRRKGSAANTQFLGESTIAAGGINEDLHKAEIQLKMTVPDYDGRRLGLGGVSVAELKQVHKLALQLKNGEGVPQAPIPPDTTEHRVDADSLDAVYEGVQQYNPAAVSDGSGSVIFGVVKSRDLVVGSSWPYITPVVPPTTVELKTTVASSNQTPGTTIYHNWGTVEWRMGENGENAWDPNFYVGNANIQQWIWAKAKIFEDKPLKGHTMKFALTRITVREIRSGSVGIQTVIYTTDKNEADTFEANPSKPQNSHAYYTPNLSIYTATPTEYNSNRYIILPNSLIEDPNGVYKGQITLVSNPEFEVLDYQLALEDQGVFKRTQ